MSFMLRGLAHLGQTHALLGRKIGPAKTSVGLNYYALPKQNRLRVCTQLGLGAESYRATEPAGPFATAGQPLSN